MVDQSQPRPSTEEPSTVRSSSAFSLSLKEAPAIRKNEHTMTPVPVQTQGKKTFRDAMNGAVLQMIEAATLGMPLEVWKTHMGRHRDQSTFQALSNIYNSHGRGFSGISAFWRGTSAKMVESATKGSVLMFSKEFIKDACLKADISPTSAGFIAGAGGGIAQVSVMGPCTYVVTCMVNGDKSKTMTQQIQSTWAAKGVKGFYPGGTAIAFRQATNWASRQGFTDAVREVMKRSFYEDPETAVLSVQHEVASGVIGGTLACWNHPFEVARIEAQSRAALGQPSMGMLSTLKSVVASHGVGGLFKGVVPRIFLGIWQTTFMVTGANLIRQHVFGEGARTGGGH